MDTRQCIGLVRNDKKSGRCQFKVDSSGQKWIRTISGHKSLMGQIVRPLASQDIYTPAHPMWLPQAKHSTFRTKVQSINTNGLLCGGLQGKHKRDQIFLATDPALLKQTADCVITVNTANEFVPLMADNQGRTGLSTSW